MSVLRDAFLRNASLISDLKHHGLTVPPEALSDHTIERLTVGAEAYSRSLRYIVESANNVTRAEMAAAAREVAVAPTVAAPMPAPVPLAA